MTNEDRYRIALERIVGLDHDEGCTSNAPLSECGCYEKEPAELAQMALDGVEWEPSSRKARTLAEYEGDTEVPEENKNEPFWQAMKLCEQSLSRLDERDFTGKSISGRCIRLAIDHMTVDEHNRLVELAEHKDCDMFRRNLEERGER